MINFSEPDTRLRVNPDTYVKFGTSDEVMLRHFRADAGVGMNAGILHVLLDLVKWTPVGDILAAWPQSDHDRLREHLDALHDKQVIITEASAAIADAQSHGAAVSPPVRFGLEHHRGMLRDYVRVAAYRRAIERAVTNQTVALDLGCGSGILSFIAARAGARKVYAVEHRPETMAVARALARTNDLAETVDFIQAMSSQLDPARLDPKPSLLVAEILGNAVLDEKVLEFTIDARERLLAPGATLIPARLDICAFAFNAGRRYGRHASVAALNDLYGFDFGILNTSPEEAPTQKTERYDAAVYTPMSSDVTVHSVDLATVRDPFFRAKCDMTATRDGDITSLCVYFRAHLDADTILTNSPWSPETHWRQLVFALPIPLPVRSGDAFTLAMAYTGELTVKLLTVG